MFHYTPHPEYSQHTKQQRYSTVRWEEDEREWKDEGDELSSTHRTIEQGTIQIVKIFRRKKRITISITSL